MERDLKDLQSIVIKQEYLFKVLDAKILLAVLKISCPLNIQLQVLDALDNYKADIKSAITEGRTND